MNIVIMGSGYVGLISGLCFAEFGFFVTFIDKDENRIKNFEKKIIPFYEPGLDELFNKHFSLTNRVKFSSNFAEPIANADVIFITVGTPSRRINDEADLSNVFSAVEEIAKNIKKYCVVITKSTVPIGTSRKIKDIIASKIPEDLFDVVSNPEFLSEGNAINDFLRPDRVIIGAETKKSKDILSLLYQPLDVNKIPIIFTDIETAEIIKYASNSFLATKVAFINEVADLCEKVGGNIKEVSKAMGLDKRIGSKFLNAGPGFGGSCFPKDLKAFHATGKKYNVNLSILESVSLSNQKRPKLIYKKILNFFSNDVKNIDFAILGLSFKPNTDDIRYSTSISIGNLLIEAGAKINAYDPKAMENVKKNYPNYNLKNDPYDTCNQVDAIILGTEWDEFRLLDLNKLKTIVKKPVIFDLRNIYDPTKMKNIGWEYISVGR